MYRKLPPETVAGRLRGLRGPLPQKQVAHGTGLSQSLVSLHESGKRNPGYKAMRSYSVFYDIPVEELFYEQTEG